MSNPEDLILQYSQTTGDFDIKNTGQVFDEQIRFWLLSRQAGDHIFTASYKNLKSTSLTISSIFGKICYVGYTLCQSRNKPERMSGSSVYQRKKTESSIDTTVRIT